MVMTRSPGKFVFMSCEIVITVSGVFTLVGARWRIVVVFMWLHLVNTIFQTSLECTICVAISSEHLYFKRKA